MAGPVSSRSLTSLVALAYTLPRGCATHPCAPRCPPVSRPPGTGSRAPVPAPTCVCSHPQVSTGNLLVILSRHYQDVSCLQFTGDSSHFLSGGKDCLVLVWSLCR